jgi:hypothetical protein
VAGSPRLEARDERERKLDQTLLRLSRTAGDVKSVSSANSRQRVKIEITARDRANVPELRKAISEASGETIVDLENHIFAMLPPSAILTLAARDEVFLMTVAEDRP